MRVQTILLLIFVCGVFTQEISNRTINVEALTAYSRWRFSNRRVYLNEEEQTFRQMVFFDNLQKINEFNSDPSNTYKMGLNQFSDMTEEEFAFKILNSEVSQENLRRIDDDNTNDPNIDVDVDVLSLAQTVDWRTKGAVTAVKNQGQCGSCWAFSASGLIESFNFIKNKKLRYFSEQQLVDCAIPANGYSNYGCQGGWPQNALSYSEKFGILDSFQYPYVAAQGKCKVTSPTSGFYPKTHKKIGAAVNDLKTALNISPVSVLVDASKWGLYSSGIFNNCVSPYKLNHAVLAIGYDASGNWIIKNQWGTNWGEQGYMRLKAGGTCGVLSSNYVITA